jgi:hypothetical protein
MIRVNEQGMPNKIWWFIIPLMFRWNPSSASTLRPPHRQGKEERPREIPGVLKYLQYQGYKLHRPSKATQSDTEQTTTGVAIELRFAYSLLEKLIQYIDRATINMKLLKPSTTFSRRTSFKTSTRDIKFFSKVIGFLFVYYIWRLMLYYNYTEWYTINNIIIIIVALSSLYSKWPKKCIMTVVV